MHWDLHLFNNQKIQFAEWEMRHMLAKVRGPLIIPTLVLLLLLHMDLPPSPAQGCGWPWSPLPLLHYHHPPAPHPGSTTAGLLRCFSLCTQESVEFIDAQMTLELHTDPYEDLIRAFKSRPIPLAHCLYQCVGLNMIWVLFAMSGQSSVSILNSSEVIETTDPRH